MGGRGASASLGLDLAYQGNNSGSGRANDSGVDMLDLKNRLSSMPQSVIENKLAAEAIEQINGIKSQNQTVTIYRATIGDSINNGDWIFLSEAQADRWTRTAFGRQKPGVKVIKRKVKVKNIGWTGKNLEFVYKGK